MAVDIQVMAGVESPMTACACLLSYAGTSVPINPVGPIHLTKFSTEGVPILVF